MLVKLLEMSGSIILGSMHQWGWLKFHLFDSQAAKRCWEWCIFSTADSGFRLVQNLVAGFPCGGRTSPLLHTTNWLVVHHMSCP